MSYLKNILFVFSIVSIFVSFSAVSETKTGSDTSAEKLAAEEKLKASFSNFSFTNFSPSPIEGIFEVHSGQQMVYFHPEKEILFFGHMYDKLGNNLTDQALTDSRASIKKDIDFSSAVTVQKGDITLLEISNPDCGFCRRFDSWVTALSDEYSIERKMIYMQNPGFRESRGKMTHIICSADKTLAHKEISEDRPVNLKTCPEADTVLIEHSAIVEQLGVQGTPTFILPNGEIIVGFKKEDIEKYLKKYQLKGNK